MLLTGLGAALLLAASARAQQDMDPTYFDVNPGTPHVERRAPVRIAVNPKLTEERKMQAQPATNLPAMQDATLEAGLVRITVADFGALMILFGGVILIALYAMAATKRERRPRPFPGASTTPPLA
jgi:hypothetical protein